MTELRVGDTVVLKSGGPRMTVASGSFGRPPSVTCQWFDGPTMKVGTFPVDGLKVTAGTEENSRRHA